MAFNIIILNHFICECVYVYFVCAFLINLSWRRSNYIQVTLTIFIHVGVWVINIYKINVAMIYPPRARARARAHTHSMSAQLDSKWMNCHFYFGFPLKFLSTFVVSVASSTYLSTCLQSKICIHENEIDRNCVLCCQ